MALQPGIDGYDTARFMRGEKRHELALNIMVTSSGDGLISSRRIIFHNLKERPEEVLQNSG